MTTEERIVEPVSPIPTAVETAGILRFLAEPIPEELIKSRQGQGGRTMRYIDARTVMSRLDDLIDLGWNWESRYSTIDPVGHAVECTISIWKMPDRYGSVLSHSDVGYPNNPGSQQEAEPLKSAYSDALKRAAVHFGIGRHLYEEGGAGFNQPSGYAAPAPYSGQGGYAQPAGYGGAPAAPTGGRPAGSYWTLGNGDMKIVCPNHGEFFARLWDRDTNVKCNGKYPDGSYCTFKVPFTGAASGMITGAGMGAAPGAPLPATPQTQLAANVLGQLKALQTAAGWGVQHLQRVLQKQGSVQVSDIMNWINSGGTLESLSAACEQVMAAENAAFAPPPDEYLQFNPNTDSLPFE